ncbi:MAG: peptidoglycan DD-metalloendopeptidase family protein [Burkholderiales bacterium]|nr:peptidoglycan DD-metalloendopeptidase family protein [Burkholderiales bacterium]
MKQSRFSRLFFSASLILILSACTSVPNHAPVLERSGEAPVEPVPPAPEPGAVKAAPELRASYTVKRGDTLLRIAFDHGQSYSDLVVWNNLKNPNDIKVDQVLWIAPPDSAGGVKTNAINTSSGIEIRSLTPINPATNKNSPKGEKRPYSEANLAEMQKQEALSASLAAQAPAVGAKSEAGTSTSKAVEKPAEKPVAADTIDWIWPSDGKLVASTGDQKNKGVDIAGRSGQDVVAAAPGKVIYEGNAMRGYGNILIIKHANNYLSAYAHNKQNLVKEGQTVSKGQRIAEMGDTDAESVRLHFEIRQAGKPVDPLKLLPIR